QLSPLHDAALAGVARAAEGVDFGDAERRPAEIRVAAGRILGADDVGAVTARGTLWRARGANVVTHLRGVARRPGRRGGGAGGGRGGRRHRRANPRHVAHAVDRDQLIDALVVDQRLDARLVTVARAAALGIEGGH